MQAPVTVGEALAVVLLLMSYAAIAGAAVGYILGSTRRS